MKNNDDLLEASDPGTDLPLAVMLQVAIQDDMKFSLRLAETAWDHGRRGLPFPTATTITTTTESNAVDSMLLSYLDNDMMLYVMTISGGLTVPESMKLGMTCHRLWSLWNHESTQRLLCQNQGALMCVMHPSLALTHPRPWWEFGQRLLAWKTAMTGRINRSYLPEPMVNSLAIRLGVKSNHGNPLGAVYTTTTNTNTTTMIDYTDKILADSKAIQRGGGFGSILHPPLMRRFEVINDPSVCTYCRNSIAVDAKAVLLPFALCCMMCWRTTGHHMRRDMAEKTYSIPRKSAKEMWQGRTFHDPFEFKTGNRSHTHPPVHVLGEDARAQAMLVHGNVDTALENSVRLMSRRRRKRALKSQRRLRFIMNLLDHHELHGQDIGWKKYTLAHAPSSLHTYLQQKMVTDFLLGLSLQQRRGFSFAERDHITKYTKSLNLALRNTKEDNQIESILGKRKATKQGGRRTSNLMLIV